MTPGRPERQKSSRRRLLLRSRRLRLIIPIRTAVVRSVRTEVDIFRSIRRACRCPLVAPPFADAT